MIKTNLSTNDHFVCHVSEPARMIIYVLSLPKTEGDTFNKRDLRILMSPIHNLELPRQMEISQFLSLTNKYSLVVTPVTAQLSSARAALY